MSGVFDHCRDARDAWGTFYSLACLCHPSQGGRREDMEALCRQARELLSPEWPPLWTTGIPNLFDIFCVATGTANPFGASIERAGEFAPAAAAEPRGWRYGSDCYSPVAPRLGDVVLVFRGSARGSGCGLSKCRA